MSNADEILTQMLESDSGSAEVKLDDFGDPIPPDNPFVVQDTLADDKVTKIQGGNLSQWSVAGNGVFFPVGATKSTLKAGVYTPYAIPGQVGLQHMPINSDGIYPLPDMATESVLKEVETFWNNESLYRKHNLLYKRGILLFGPPGSGKTITVKMLMKEIIRRDGIVIICQHVGLTTSVLRHLRAIEPKRNLIVVLEDIDEIIAYNGESQVLSLLDGEHNIDNVLNIATTNFPDRLGARIVNRPSRFDRRVLIDMPNDDARAAYLQATTHTGLSDDDLQKWVADTKSMSLAHLRELVAAVYCLGQPYEEVIKRLKDMAEPPVTKNDGFAKARKSGFSNSASSERNW